MLKTPLLTRLTNGFIPLYFIGLLTLPKGYDSPFLLMIVALFYALYALVKKTYLPCRCDTKYLIASFFLYFLTFFISMWVHQDSASVMDSASKVLLFLPILLLLNKHPILFKMLVISLPLGGISAGLIALYQRLVLHTSASFQQIFQIQGGDISMSLGMFSLIACLYFLQKNASRLALFALSGALLGMTGSYLSTARGGWIAVPVLLLLLGFLYHRQVSKKALLLVLLSIITTTTVVFYTPNFGLMSRYTTAVNEISGGLAKENGHTSIGIRFNLWKSAYLMAQEKPWLGFGKNLIPQKEKYAEQGLISPDSTRFNHQHNQFLDDLSKRGIVGLIGLLAIFLVPLVFFIKHLRTQDPQPKTLATLGVIHVLSTMSYCLSQAFFCHMSGVMFYFFILVLLYAMINQQQKTIN